MSSSPIKYFISLFLLLFLNSASCERDEFNFPYVPVNIYLGLYSDLADLGPGQFGFYSDQAGVNGLIIYRSAIYDNVFSAFDRTCTHEVKFDCKLTEDPENDFLISCPCCGSQYLIYDDEGGASVFKGPARYPLVEYTARVEGAQLHITN